MKNIITFAISNRNNILFEQLIDNEPFRLAYGSILEGRFPFYKNNCN